MSLGGRGRDKPAPSYPGDTENFEKPTKCRRSRLFADPQAGIERRYPALNLTLNYFVSRKYTINSTCVGNLAHMLLHNYITC
jgi:hypothetical protein